MVHHGQDWTPVVFNKQQHQPTITTVRSGPRVGGQGYEKDLRTPATEEAPVLKPLLRLSPEDRQSMIQARVAKKWTQSDLAKQLHLPVSVIQTMEQGKVIENPQHLQNIHRVLGIKLKISK